MTEPHTLYVFGTGNATMTRYYNTCFAIRSGEELQALNELGVGLGLRLGRIETEETDLHAALFDDFHDHFHTYALKR